MHTLKLFSQLTIGKFLQKLEFKRLENSQKNKHYFRIRKQLKQEPYQNEDF